MTHLLIIRDAAGKEIARIPVAAGYTIKEIAVPKDQKPAPAPDKAASTGDAGSGQEKVG